MKNEVALVPAYLEIICLKHRMGIPKHWRWSCVAAALLLVLFGSAPRAAAVGQLTVTPTSISFGNVAVGKTATVSVTVKNIGNATVTLSGDTLTGGVFKLSGITVPRYIYAGSSMTFSVIFAPVNIASYTGKITLISNASNPSVAISLAGAGIKNTTVGYVSATPVSAQFGNVPIGTRNTQTVQLKNTGATTLTVSSLTPKGTGISVSGPTVPFSLLVGGVANLTVAFLPTVAGTVSGSVTIASNALDSSLSVAVTGTGVTATRVIAANPASIAFGNVTLNTTVERQIYVTNTGNSSLYISGHTVSGAGFTAIASSGVTLAPGQGMTFKADFDPKTAGSVSGSIAIASNATNTTSLKVPLSGTGVTATTTHKVTLVWNASTTSGVTGYYVYRATASGGPYTRISSLLSGTTYTDTSVTSGATYYYAVTAMESTGAQSGYSNQVTAKIP